MPFYIVFLFTFLEGQVHQMERNVVFSNHIIPYIVLHLIYLPIELCKHCHFIMRPFSTMKKAS